MAHTFGRIFDLPPFAEPTPAVSAALIELGRAGGVMDARDEVTKPPALLCVDPDDTPEVDGPPNSERRPPVAGMTFLGQFLNHDLTLDLGSRLGVPTSPERAPNARSPGFDLDTVYGPGSPGSLLFEPGDDAKLRVESGGIFEDLPRSADGAPMLVDLRNDENLLVAGLHAAFLLFHNRVVDHLRGRRVREFGEFRRAVTWHYQWIILNEYLPQIVGQSLVDRILRDGRRHYRPAGAPFVPVEFQLAFRMGHSMVRPAYRANVRGDRGAPFVGPLFDPTAPDHSGGDPVDLRGGARASRRYVDWQTFFDFGVPEPSDRAQPSVRSSRRIDTKIATPLFRLPLEAIPSHDVPTSLPQRTLLRHLTWSVPSGQQLAAAMGEPAMTADTFPELAELAAGLEHSTPLWYYVLKEAELQCEGLRLGPVGGRLVAETFIGMVQEDPASYLTVNPGWRPTLPGRDCGDFRMTDLLTFAGVDPASRATSYRS